MGEVNKALKLLMVLLLLLASLCFVGVKGYAEELQDEEVVKERGGADEGEGGRRGLFMMGKAKKVVETAGGEVRVVSGLRWKGDPNPMHIGFISMEPNTLLIPQYIDSNLILFVQSGEAKVGWICKDKMVEKHLKKGDVNVISAGSAFYVVNMGEGQKLHVICSIDTSESISYGSTYESFFVGGGRYPTSVLAGFDISTLTAAFNISSEQLAMLMRSQRNGPIIYMNNEQMDRSKKSYMDDDDDDDIGDDGEDEDGTGFSWRKMLGGGGDGTKETERRRSRAPHAYNLYAEKPSYENSYGWSIAIDENDYEPLKHTGVGVYLVNLTEGSMMAPHLNPRATEYGVVLRGSGTVQVVFPNGTAAMNAAVAEGDVFWVPRYFPFCQAASSGGGPMEFFGFTTSARRNRPQFLVGASSVLRSMRGPELAAAFGVAEDQLKEMVRAQREGIILPYSAAAADQKEKKEEEGVDMHGGFIIV